MSQSNGRIPADQSQGFTAWQLPEVKQGQVIAVEKINKRGPRGELVNVEKDEVVYSALTAGQLDEITQQAYDEIRQQAHEEGLKQGRDEGYNAGLAEGREVVQQQLNNLQSTLHSLHNVLEGQDDELEQALVNLSTCIARSILQRELSIDNTHIQSVVNEAVAALPLKEDRLVVHLNPEDYQLLIEQKDIPEQWTLQKDAAITAGGCRVVSRHSVVDYTLEEQFQQTINGLVEKRFTELAQQAQQRSTDATASNTTDPNTIPPGTDS
jgi:flagellar assembly protein FliH